MVIDFDDFGCNHIISDMCQSHDCRNKLLELKQINPKFKVTLFTIPGEITSELIDWCTVNSAWVEIAVHGFYHNSNYECEKMSYQEFDELMNSFEGLFFIFEKGFKAPGWQISDDIYIWLVDHGWWVADQSYNNERRPNDLPTYINDNGNFTSTIQGPVEAWHGHTWDCVGNGIYETFDQLAEVVKNAESFEFVSEVLR